MTYIVLCFTSTPLGAITASAIGCVKYVFLPDSPIRQIVKYHWDQKHVSDNTALSGQLLLCQCSFCTLMQLSTRFKGATAAHLHGDDFAWAVCLLHGSTHSSSGFDSLTVPCVLQGSSIGVLPKPPDSAALQLGPCSFFCCCLAQGGDGGA